MAQSATKLPWSGDEERIWSWKRSIVARTHGRLSEEEDHGELTTLDEPKSVITGNDLIKSFG